MVVREEDGLVIWWGERVKERLRERCLMDRRDEAMVVRVFQGWERLGVWVWGVGGGGKLYLPILVRRLRCPIRRFLARGKVRRDGG